MRSAAVLVLVMCLASPSVFAGELAGVSLPDQVTVGDATLQLNGMGLRKKLWVEVYVAGLYLEQNTTDAEAAVSAAGAKRVVMHFLTDRATKKKMDEAWLEGFKSNSPEVYPTLAERVATFVGLFGDMKDGDRIELTIIPGTGTAATLNGVEKGTIEGDDFSQALLRVWLGDSPPSPELRSGLLGSS